MVTAFSTIVLGILLGLIAAFYSARSITKPLNAAISGLKDVAEDDADLTMRLNM